MVARSIWCSVAVLATAVVCLALAGGALAAMSTNGGLASLLAARDPGARVGGNTIVATTAGERVYGVSRRPNFIAALGSRETIVSGAVGDELGAVGDGVRIESRGGHGMIVDLGNNGRILVGGRGNTVVVSGSRDSVVCARGSGRDVIYIARTDTVDTACRTEGNTVLFTGHLHARPRAAASAASVTGTGTNADPYVEQCTQRGSPDQCAIVFPARTLSGFWANEYVPSYKCPANRPFLVDRDVNQAFGTKVPRGVQIEGLGPIGVSITRTLPVTVDTPTLKVTGMAGQTATGYPNSSATNWTFGSNSYRVVLHCNFFSEQFYPAGGV